MTSVCIATYNGEKYIKEQLDSILSQLEGDDEVIISDDGSVDNTVAIINSYKDKRIRIFFNSFKSPIKNFEFTLTKAVGDIIFLSDQDDLWLPGKVKHLREVLKDYDMVVTDHSVIDDMGNIILKSYFAEVPSKPGIIKNLIKNTYYGCCMAFKKEVSIAAIPFPKDIPMHDIWLGFVAELYFKTCFINYPYTQYRKHVSNVSNATEIKSGNSIFKKMKFRINIIKYLPHLINKNFKKQ